MSGNNQNGYAESKRLLLGLGDLYIDNVFVGNLKGTVTMNVTRNYAFQRPGNNIADQKGEATSEEVMITAEVCDLKLSQLRRAFGVDSAVDTATAKSIRKREVLQLNGVIETTTTETISGTTAKVDSLDRKTQFVSGGSDDFETSATGVKRAVGSTIGDGDFVIVEYQFSDAGASSMRFGGETKTPNTFALIFTHLDSSGKYWQVTLFKAQTNTDFSIAFNERESGDYTVHNVSFKALVDTTKPEGQNLFEIIQEDAAA